MGPVSPAAGFERTTLRGIKSREMSQRYVFPINRLICTAIVPGWFSKRDNAPLMGGILVRIIIISLPNTFPLLLHHQHDFSNPPSCRCQFRVVILGKISCHTGFSNPTPPSPPPIFLPPSNEPALVGSVCLESPLVCLMGMVGKTCFVFYKRKCNPTVCISFTVHNYLNLLRNVPRSLVLAVS